MKVIIKIIKILFSIYINMTNKNLHSSKQKIISLKKLGILRNKTENWVESNDKETKNSYNKTYTNNKNPKNINNFNKSIIEKKMILINYSNQKTKLKKKNRKKYQINHPNLFF